MKSLVIRCNGAHARVARFGTKADAAQFAKASMRDDVKVAQWSRRSWVVLTNAQVAKLEWPYPGYANAEA